MTTKAEVDMEPNRTSHRTTTGMTLKGVFATLMAMALTIGLMIPASVFAFGDPDGTLATSESPEPITEPLPDGDADGTLAASESPAVADDPSNAGETSAAIDTTALASDPSGSIDPSGAIETTAASSTADITAVSWALYDDGTFVINGNDASVRNGANRTNGGTFDSTMAYKGSGKNDRAPWELLLAKVTTIVIENELQPATTSYLFNGFYNAKEIIGLERLDTSKVTNMQAMFKGCKALTSLDVSVLDTSQVTDMSYMFQFCTSLRTLEQDWDMRSVKYLYSMLHGCSELDGLDVSGWQMGSAIRVDSMFQDCKGLSSLDVSSWDVGNVRQFDYMFQHCEGLTSIDVSEWDTGSAISTYSMFSDCANLSDLDVSGFDMSDVLNINYMFQNCTSLEAIDVSKWDTSSAQFLMCTFSGCSSLRELNLTDWDVSKATTFEWMFNGCKSLRTIYCDDAWDASVTSTNMFYNCTSIFSETSDMSYDAKHVDGAMANPQTGYFTIFVPTTPVTITPQLDKQLDGGDIADFDGEFRFALSPSDATPDAPMPDSAIAANDADGLVRWDDITFDASGVYEYEITEIDDGKPGVTYDDAVHTMRVEVTSDKQHVLSASVLYDHGYVPGDDELVLRTFGDGESVSQAGTRPTSLAEITESSFEANGDSVDYRVIVNWPDVAMITGPTVSLYLGVVSDDGSILKLSELKSNPAGNTTIEFAGTMDLGSMARIEGGGYPLVLGYRGMVIVPGVFTGMKDEAHWFVLDSVAGPDVLVGSDELTVTNAYAKPEERPRVSFAPQITVGIENGSISDYNGRFSFELRAVNGAPLPASTTVVNENGRVAWEGIAFERPGTYRYQIVVTMADDGEGAFEEVVYEYAIVVVEGADGSLSATGHLNYEEDEDGRIVPGENGDQQAVLPNPDATTEPDPDPEPGPKPGPGTDPTPSDTYTLTITNANIGGDPTHAFTFDLALSRNGEAIGGFPVVIDETTASEPDASGSGASEPGASEPVTSESSATESGTSEPSASALSSSMQVGADGKLRFKLRGNQVATISGLPEDADFTVSQDKDADPAEGYRTSVDGDATAIKSGSMAGSHATVAFANELKDEGNGGSGDGAGSGDGSGNGTSGDGSGSGTGSGSGNDGESNAGIGSSDGTSDNATTGSHDSTGTSANGAYSDGTNSPDNATAASEADGDELALTGDASPLPFVALAAFVAFVASVSALIGRRSAGRGTSSVRM